MALTDVKQNYGEFFGGKEPVELIFEDEQCVVFDEKLNKQAPVHFLVVPKKVIPTLMEVSASAEDEKTLGHLLLVARRVAKMKGIDKSGFRVVMNEGPHSCQTVKQFYVQVFGGRQMLWPFS
ncbi:adenosine 5'-monophosphoramidase HINT2-like isoform X2 [Spodoptera frugiperda]|uniref:Adenosine 5'-monophosphoramidase HINT2-like isoform X2 n=1 Tax=Spodoptera frugiperda TaxID=7108 RepID=A0A9R0E4R4_SPOFR|nr:adenosine 5'-monophosphoramidase HINT2-like isoform X2 [Spodoptera frugiperda]